MRGDAPGSLAWIAAAEASGERLDRHVAEHLGEPRNQVQRWIREGWVEVNGRPARPSAAVAAGDAIACRPPARREERIAPEAEPLAVIYEDADLAVLDKPAGLTVHPGAGRATGTLAHRLLARYPEIAGVGGAGRPGIVHRLDRETSGVLVVARTPAAYARLARAFAEREVGKRYLAIVYGAPEPPAGVIAAPIGRHPTRRTEMAVRPAGRPARTRYRTVAAAAGIALLALDLETGRTHQIRVHLKSLGRPLVGDPVYGEARWKGLPRKVHGPLAAFPRPALHAWRLAFRHPATGEPLAFEAPMPADLEALWKETTGTGLPALPAMLALPPGSGLVEDQD
jgi:23S rRNA pseudouridine1911/1915/1917 synthase